MANSTPEPSWGLRRQIGIYQEGLAGKMPEHRVSVDQLELEAKSVLKTEAFDYVAGAAGAEDTMQANRDAFRRWRIVPRFLRDVSQRDLAVEVLGLKLRARCCWRRSACRESCTRRVSWPWRGPRALGVPMILSTVSSFPMETVAAALGDTPRWFQLYWPRNDELAASFIHRAELAGYSAIVVTLDTYLLAWRKRRYPKRVSAILPR